jgi:hypothetical protein
MVANWEDAVRHFRNPTKKNDRVVNVNRRKSSWRLIHSFSPIGPERNTQDGWAPGPGSMMT